MIFGISSKIRPDKSTILIWAISLFYLASFFSYGKWQESSLISSDPAGYYVYLPAAFIYHDLKNLKTTEAGAGKYRPDLYAIHQIIGGTELPNGNVVNKYSMGLAIMHLPFFLLACLVSPILGFPVDGFSAPFRFLIYLGSLFYVITALGILRLVLKQYFEDKVVATVLLIITLGTNLYFYSVHDSVMAHSYLFFLYSALLFSTIKWYHNLKEKFAWAIGLCCGLITLSRPNEIISIFIPLLYGISYFNSWRLWLKFLQRFWKAHAVMVLIFIAVGIPQLIYWKVLSGKFLFYSYGKEGFDFIHPHIFSGLFSFRNGWLIYTPIMIFALAGIPLLPKSVHFRIPVIAYFLVYVYVIYSYWAWDYSNGFGSRPMVETYPMLTLPLGYFTRWIFQKRIRQVLYFFCIAFLTLLNIFQVWQYDRGILWTSFANANSYAYLFGKTSMTTKGLILYDINQTQPDNLSYERTAYSSHFIDSLDQHYQKKVPGNPYFVKSSQEEFLHFATLTNDDLALQKGEYVKISISARNDNSQADLWNMTSLVTSIDVDGKSVFWKNMRMQNKSGNTHPSLWNTVVGEWYNVQYFLCLPDNLPAEYKFNIYLWDGCKCNQVAVDDLSVEVWK